MNWHGKTDEEWASLTPQEQQDMLFKKVQDDHAEAERANKAALSEARDSVPEPKQIVRDGQLINVITVPGDAA